MIKKSPRLLSALSLIMLCVIVAFFVWRSEASNTPALASVEVRLGNIEDAVTAAGTLQPAQYVDVGVQVSGQIQSIPVTVGTQVRKGMLLAQIDPAVQQSTVEAGRAMVESQRAAIRQQQAQLQLNRLLNTRQQQMLADGATSLQEAQTSAANLQVAQAQLESLQAQMRQSTSTLKGDEAKLGYTKIFAPMDGTVISLDASVGQTVNAVQQTPVIMRIADLTRMTVLARVSEADVPRLNSGMPVYFSTLGYPNDRWVAQVRQILPAPMNSVSSASNGSSSGGGMGGSSLGGSTVGAAVYYTVLFDVDNTDGRLMPQMTAQVFFVVSAARQVPIVPLSALTPIAGSSDFGVMVLDAKRIDSAATFRRIEIGARSAVAAQVISGLEIGDHVQLTSSPGAL